MNKSWNKTGIKKTKKKQRLHKLWADISTKNVLATFLWVLFERLINDTVFK